MPPANVCQAPFFLCQARLFRDAELQKNSARHLSNSASPSKRAGGRAPAGILRDGDALAWPKGANAAYGPKGPVGIGTFGAIDGVGVNEHDSHERVVVRGRRDDGEHLWLMCWECSEIMRKVRMCGQLTRKGTSCRSAVLETDKSACRVHIGTRTDGE